MYISFIRAYTNIKKKMCIRLNRKIKNRKTEN